MERLGCSSSIYSDIGADGQRGYHLQSQAKLSITLKSFFKYFPFVVLSICCIPCICKFLAHHIYYLLFAFYLLLEMFFLLLASVYSYLKMQFRPC